MALPATLTGGGSAGGLGGPPVPASVAGPAAAGMPLPKGPNYGSDAQVVSKVRAAVKILQELAGTIDPASDIGKAVFDSIKKLSAHAPANKATQGLENTALQDIAAKAKQSAPLMGLMGGAAGIPQGGSGSPLGAAAPKPV